MSYHAALTALWAARALMDDFGTWLQRIEGANTVRKVAELGEEGGAVAAAEHANAEAVGSGAFRGNVSFVRMVARHLHRGAAGDLLEACAVALEDAAGRAMDVVPEAVE
jgi:hypothetical protein